MYFTEVFISNEDFSVENPKVETDNLLPMNIRPARGS